MPTKPGGPPSGAPTGFEFLADERLLTNGNLTRMPTTQREWNGFVQELNKWTKNEFGAFDPQFGGFSVDPGTWNGDGPSVLYHRYGQIVTLSFYFTTGTSNQTSFTIGNLPAVITPLWDQSFPLFNMVDNGVTLTAGGVTIDNTGTLRFHSDHDEGTWTASGTKGIKETTYPKTIMYSLMNPPKL